MSEPSKCKVNKRNLESAEKSIAAAYELVENAGHVDSESLGIRLHLARARDMVREKRGAKG